MCRTGFMRQINKISPNLKKRISYLISRIIRVHSHLHKNKWVNKFIKKISQKESKSKASHKNAVIITSYYRTIFLFLWQAFLRAQPKSMIHSSVHTLSPFIDEKKMYCRKDCVRGMKTDRNLILTVHAWLHAEWMLTW
jgi:hypothetical protein